MHVPAREQGRLELLLAPEYDDLGLFAVRQMDHRRARGRQDMQLEFVVDGSAPHERIVGIERRQGAKRAGTASRHCRRPAVPAASRRLRDFKARHGGQGKDAERVLIAAESARTSSPELLPR